MLPDPFYQTILLLSDDLPGFQREAAEKLGSFLKQSGYRVKAVTAKAFIGFKQPWNDEGFLFLLPQSDSLPIALSPALRQYATRGGQILVLGGPLFYDLVEPNDDGVYEKKPIASMLDATFAQKEPPFVIEGITPSYKTYSVKGVFNYKPAPNQSVFDGKIQPDRELHLICPSGAIYGGGYGNERRNRFLPIVNAFGAKSNDFRIEGRAGGRRGSAAYFMLSDTRNGEYKGKVRPGIVDSTVVGSVAAAIGIKEADLLSVAGTERLLLSMIAAMQRGLFLFEGGVKGYRLKPDEPMVFGTRVLNAARYYKTVKVIFRLKQRGKTIFQTTKELLCVPRNISELEFTLASDIIRARLQDGGDDITVQTVLRDESGQIDLTEQEISFVAPQKPKKTDFVSVKDGDFYLGGKPWHLLGINYWPLYYPALELTDYWCGFLDKANYDPVTVEEDLAYLEKMGINCLLTRLDTYRQSRLADALGDFLERCARHGMKVSLSYPTTTCPIAYSREAFLKFVRDNALTNNPTVLCHDIAWEAGGDFLQPYFRENTVDAWNSWVIDRYGSVASALADWKDTQLQKPDGTLSPPEQKLLLTQDGDHRILAAAYRRFLDDFISGLWKEVYRDIKQIDPNHLVAYRYGEAKRNTIAYTAAVKHNDFICPEGYGITGDKDGADTASFMTVMMRHFGGGKPVVWGEFGASLCGTKWGGVLHWDHDNLCYHNEKIQEQTAYHHSFFEFMGQCGVKGSAPWWWCGGFRLSELADFGYVGPDGTLRPCALEYIDFLKKLDTQKPYTPDTFVTVDRELTPFGDHFVSETLGKVSWSHAKEEGKTLGVKTAGTDTDSGNVPLVAVGNTPYNGKNPPKYLNAEINFVTLRQGKKTYTVQNGDRVKLKPEGDIFIEIGAGNLGEAKWLAPNAFNDAGGVLFTTRKESELSFQIPILTDTPYLSDAKSPRCLFTSAIHKTTTVVFSMEAKDRAVFGEVFRFVLDV